MFNFDNFCIVLEALSAQVTYREKLQLKIISKTKHRYFLNKAFKGTVNSYLVVNRVFGRNQIFLLPDLC